MNSEARSALRIDIMLLLSPRRDKFRKEEGREETRITFCLLQSSTAKVCTVAIT